MVISINSNELYPLTGQLFLQALLTLGSSRVYGAQVWEYTFSF